MARNPYRRYEVTEYQKEALKFLQPPEDITVSEWADKYRVLDAKTSAMPGPWRTEHTPSFTFLPEMSLEYACIIAAKATKLPVEFFKGLHPKEAVKVKNRVTAFFYGAE